MENLEKRIEKLEAVDPAKPMRAVRMLNSESERECRIRLQIPDVATNVLFIQRVIVEVPRANNC